MEGNVSEYNGIADGESIWSNLDLSIMEDDHIAFRKAKSKTFMEVISRMLLEIYCSELQIEMSMEKSPITTSRIRELSGAVSKRVIEKVNSMFPKIECSIVVSTPIIFSLERVFDKSLCFNKDCKDFNNDIKRKPVGGPVIIAKSYFAIEATIFDLINYASIKWIATGKHVVHYFEYEKFKDSNEDPLAFYNRVSDSMMELATLSFFGAKNTNKNTC